MNGSPLLDYGCDETRCFASHIAQSHLAGKRASLGIDKPGRRDGLAVRIDRALRGQPDGLTGRRSDMENRPCPIAVEDSDGPMVSLLEIAGRAPVHPGAKVIL
jgi:hypothetical protein